MHAGDATLKDYFQSELEALRGAAQDFASAHPQHGAALGLQARQAADPHVELLMQSFAFLTGRLQHQVETDRAALPNQLLALLYPHLEAPLPAMLVAQLAVRPDGANFASEQVLARGRYLSAPVNDHLGHTTECRFRSCCATPLVPLRVERLSLQPASHYPFVDGRPATLSVLSVRIVAEGPASFNASGTRRLRFYVDGGAHNGYALYDALAAHVSGIALQLPGQPPLWLAPDALRWLGEAEDEAMLPSNPNTHPGYRLLQEYFAFPDKFLFFELQPLALGAAFEQAELLFMLDLPDPGLALDAALLRLNCVPLVNLYSQRIDPVTLDHSEYEYQLFGDIVRHRYCEIVALESLESIRPDGSPRQLAPYFAMGDFRSLAEQDYFYLTRRALSQAPGVAGTELHVSFLDQRFDLAQLADEVIGGRALCTNRRLPEQLQAGGTLFLEGAGPATRAIALARPTAHQSPADVGSRPWSLVSQLSLNHLSLADGPAALGALKDILRLHIGGQRKAGFAQVDALRRLACRSVVRHQGKDGWRGFVRGIHVTLEIDRSGFDRGSAVLFCSVLRHFLSLYASVNQLVEVSLETGPNQGVPLSWPPLSGARPQL